MTLELALWIMAIMNTLTFVILTGLVVAERKMK